MAGSIFVTVGSQTPFDRLVRAMNDWAVAHPMWQVHAQIGRSGLRAHELRALQLAQSLPERAYRERMRSSTLVVAHAGMGTVLTALELGCPMVLLPRRSAWRETRNDHQLGTARWLMERRAEDWRIEVAVEASDLPSAIERSLDRVRSDPWDVPMTLKPVPLPPPKELIQYLGGFIDEAAGRA